MPTPTAKLDVPEITQAAASPRARAWYRHLSVQILVAMLLGVTVGYLRPQSAETLKPLGDLFIKLVRMLVAPIIFCTVVHGIASVGEAKKVGRIAIKSRIYFEVVTTIAARRRAPVPASTSRRPAQACVNFEALTQSAP